MGKKKHKAEEIVAKLLQAQLDLIRIWGSEVCPDNTPWTCGQHGALALSDLLGSAPSHASGSTLIGKAG